MVYVYPPDLRVGSGLRDQAAQVCLTMAKIVLVFQPPLTLILDPSLHSWNFYVPIKAYSIVCIQ